MEPSKEAIAVRVTRLNRQILGKVIGATNKLNKRILDRETLLDALTVLYDECNDDPVKKSDDLVRAFVDKYRSTLADLRRTRVCLSDFDLIQSIGRGHFGEVHMVREKETGDVYAMKTLRKEQSRKQRVGAAEDERDVLANANSPWIPRLQYAFQDNSHLYLVMELCPGGDLAGLLARRGQPLAERDAAFYVAEVAHALKALHAMGYVHRDVNPNNILLDRCGHVKLGDLGSCARLAGEGCAALAGATPDYVAPELLAPACGAEHAVCLQYCRGIVSASISAVDYWSLGVVAFELVTLRRPFSDGDGDSVSKVLNNIQNYERSPEAGPPFEAAPRGPSAEWRSLVAGLLRVPPARRFAYLDTLRHPALRHAAPVNIREQAPPWVPCVRGPEDASFLASAPRAPRPPDAAPFRARPPFAGQLPFVGYSYVAPEESEETTMSSGFNASHDCTAIDMATFKSAEKLAAMRGREVACLQHKLAAAEAAAADAAARARSRADCDAERTRARLQADITALTLQLKRLERQIEVEKEERMALERTNQELNSRISERNNAALAEVERERDVLREGVGRLEAQVQQLQAECARAQTAADAAKMTQQHYKDTIAKERALRRQTLSGGDEAREVAVRLASAEAGAAREARGRAEAEARLAGLDADNTALRADNEALKIDNATLQRELDASRKELLEYKNSLSERQAVVDTSSEQLKIAQQDLAQERVRVTSLTAQVQELERGIEEAARRETSLEEQSLRTEARLRERLDDAERRAGAALRDHARHREKVTTLEQLVHRLEREVSALERRVCPECASRASAEREHRSEHREHTPRKQEKDKTAAADAYSDTESVGDGPHVANAQLTVLKEQLERAEATLQARADEVASLKQEARNANLARWRKEKEYNELSLEAKSSARELKRVEERLSAVLEAKKTAEQKVSELQKEIATLRPEHERASKEAQRLREQMDKMQKALDTAQAEVDRSRNDIRKLKSELTYSERRRLHAEQQEELSSRECARARDELHQLRARSDDLEQNNKALQEACSLLEEQLTDLEKLADHHELKNKDLESQLQRVRSDLDSSRARLAEAERQAAHSASELGSVARQHDEARGDALHAHCQLKLLQERLQSREQRVAELEARYAELESAHLAREAALGAAARRVRELQEEAAALRTRAHQHHAAALQLQAALAETQEELSCARESAEAAAAWWRTRETKADATLRQQAKLIDFLQAKVEEAGRKKCSLSNKLFGRSGRRTPASPPLRRANRELREEVEKLRAKLSVLNGDDCPPTTPRREKPKQKRSINGRKSNESATGDGDDLVTVVWSDGSRESMSASQRAGRLRLQPAAGRALLAAPLAARPERLSHEDCNRAFMVKLEESPRDNEVAVVCKSVAARADWLAKLTAADPGPAPGYAARALCSHRVPPNAALYLAEDAVLIGGPDGLHSLRGAIHLESPQDSQEVTWLAATESRVLAVCGAASGAAGGAARAALWHAARPALASAARRSPQLRAAAALQPVSLPDGFTPHLLVTLTGESKEAGVAAVAGGRRVCLLRADAEPRAARSLTVDRAPHSLLLTSRALYIAGDKPLKINLPSGALEAFAMDEPIIAAAARKHSPPKKILLIRENPVEILMCYSELGVFLDENGKRTRNEDPKWSAAVHAWAFVHPFLYVIGEDRVTIVYITDEVYRSPPCTCDTSSLASTTSECYTPQIFNLKMKEPYLLGTAPTGVIIRSKDGDKYNVSVVEGMAAFRSIGASVESLETNSDVKGSLTDLAQSMTDLLDGQASQDVSHESVEETSGFLADIRKRAQQLRNKHRKEQNSNVSSDDVIKQILMTEVGIKRMSNGRKSPDTSSEFDSDSTATDEQRSASTKDTADVCAEMFTRQVRFE